MPIPGESGNAVDYIYSADNLIYSDWKKTFVLFPRRSTFNKSLIWFRVGYTRTRKMKIDPPQFPRHHLNRTEWATPDEMVYLKLKGIDI